MQSELEYFNKHRQEPQELGELQENYPELAGSDCGPIYPNLYYTDLNTTYALIQNRIGNKLLQ